MDPTKPNTTLNANGKRTADSAPQLPSPFLPFLPSPNILFPQVNRTATQPTNHLQPTIPMMSFQSPPSFKPSNLYTEKIKNLVFHNHPNLYPKTTQKTRITSRSSL